MAQLTWLHYRLCVPKNPFATTNKWGRQSLFGFKNNLIIWQKQNSSGELGSPACMKRSLKWDFRQTRTWYLDSPVCSDFPVNVGADGDSHFCSETPVKGELWWDSAVTYFTARGDFRFNKTPRLYSALPCDTYNLSGGYSDKIPSGGVIT